MNKEKGIIKAIAGTSRYTIWIVALLVFCLVIIVFSLVGRSPVADKSKPTVVVVPPQATGVAGSARALPVALWQPPDIETIPAGKAGDSIRYGQELLANTAKYLGPQGTVAHLTNGMNCQNCHLAGGSKIFGINYAAVNATYPKFSRRSGNIQSIYGRIKDCFERSLAGRSPDTMGREVKSMMAYIKWIGKDVKKGSRPFGSGSESLPYMNRAADPGKGKLIFVMKCRTCHGNNGEGTLAADKKSYTYPPLWGKDSYNDGAGMHMISRLAAFVKNNMPFGATYQNPQLTDEEAWDVAAFVNSQARPHKDQFADWKDIKLKPEDYPYGPYADTFSEKQHKYGPFKPIINSQKESHSKLLTAK